MLDHDGRSVTQCVGLDGHNVIIVLEQQEQGTCCLAIVTPPYFRPLSQPAKYQKSGQIIKTRKPGGNSE